MKTDRELLEMFVTQKDETAFNQLIERHLNLVYGTALRGVAGDRHLAEDASQEVFTALALKAKNLRTIKSLGGWLYRSSRYEASNLMRKERSRQDREQEVYQMKIEQESDVDESETDWARLRPILDDHLSTLSPKDQDAVVMRFYENRSYNTIADNLSLSENAARMRVKRALEKLQKSLGKKGFVTTTTTLSTVLSGQNADQAPIGLASALQTKAIAAVSAGPGPFVLVSNLQASQVATWAIYALGSIALSGIVFGYQTNLNREALLEQIAAIEASPNSIDIESEPPPIHSAQKTEQSLTSPPGFIDRREVEARYQRAQTLSRSGQYREALIDFLWCFDTGMPAVSSYRGVRVSFLLASISKMGENYPPATAALKKRRDTLSKLISENNASAEQLDDWTSLNRSLNESELSYQLYEEMDEDDPLRPNIAKRIFEKLVEHGRYSDAMETTTFQKLLAQSQRQMEPPPKYVLRNMEGRGDYKSSYAIESAIESVEVLAGSGQIENAVKFAMHLLEYDNSDQTKTQLRSSLLRANALAVYQAVVTD